jgi:hypothetical protein
MISLVVVHGRCTRLQIGVNDLSAACAGRMNSESFQNGRSGFTFGVPHFALITFSGLGTYEVKKSSTDIVQPVDTILATMVQLRKEPFVLHAVGSCEFNRPDNGAVYYITCVATTSIGPYSASFISDGQPPKVIGQ